MSCSKNQEKNKLLDLETDLTITSEDSRRLEELWFRPELTFEEYIDFLEEIDAFATRKPDPVIFEEVFTLS